MARFDLLPYFCLAAESRLRRAAAIAHGSSPESTAAAAAAVAVAAGSRKSYRDSDEKADCQNLHYNYMECIKLWGDGHRVCAEPQQKLEELCGKYKSEWSTWWTEDNDQYICETWTRLLAD